MGRYILKRILETLLLLVLVSLLVFFLLQLMPGDPVDRIIGEEADPAMYDATKKMFGLDKPPIVQYWNWLMGVLKGDFGLSYVNYESVTAMIGDRLPTTMFLALISLVISSVIGVLLGIVTALNRGKWIDTVLTTMANVLSAVPNFWLGVVLIYIFAVKLRVLPLYGFYFPWTTEVSTVKALKTLVLPITCMSIGSIAGICRQTRSAMLEVIRQDYIRTARSKGVPNSKVTFKHALKNALIPIVTSIGGRLSTLVGGSTFIESVFVIEGMGQLLVNATTQSNVPVIQACVLLVAVVGCVANLIVDLLYGILDPRIRLN